MARARNIKPAFFTNEVLASMSYQTQLFFIGLWTLADREGRMEDRPLRIKAALFPYGRADVEAMLNQLQDEKFLTRYELDGNKYIQIINFVKHQAPHFKEKKSVIPGPNSGTPQSSPVPALVKPGASTVNYPVKPPNISPDSLIPDSLIPDSLSTATPEIDFSSEVFEIAKFHPRIAHKAKGPNRIEQEAIAGAIALAGRDLVLAGTRELADAVARWPESEHKFIPEPVKFYRDEYYRKPASYWDKSKSDAMAGKEGLGLGKAPEPVNQEELDKMQAEIKAQNERMKARAANR